MPRKKKSFIDRKNSSTYHLVHRSQRDVGVLNDDGTNEALSQFVLMPSSNNAAHRLAPIEIDDRSNDDEEDESAATRSGRDERRSVVMTELSDRLSRAGLTDDYDYDRHVRPVTGSGTFLGAVGKTDAGAKRANDARARTAPALEEELGDLVGGGEEVGRRLDSIALTPACMDDDVAEALFSDDFEAQGFEEILDDFVLTASSDAPHDGGEGAPPEQKEEEAFDFDAHVRRLMERAQSQARSDSVLPSDLVARHEWAERARAFFADARPLGGRGDGDGDDDDVPSDLDLDDDELGPLPNDGVAPRLTDEEERALVERFERTLLEYDDDGVGDLEEQCGHVGGDRPLEGDAALERALDEFLEDREDDVLVAGAPRRAGGSGFSALVGNRMVRAEELSETAVTNVDGPIDDDDANPVIPPELEPPEEDVLIDGKSYFSVSVRNPWDCESILSTYSNLDNNPVTVGRRSRRHRKKPTRNDDDDDDDDEEPRLITLSDKTGLPTGVLPTKEKKERDRSPTSSAAAAPPPQSVRCRGETAEDKRSRKQRVKEERRVSRLQKKLTKDAFKEEFQRVSMKAGTDDVGGRTVFRYS